jgi:hypothetical protein
MRATVLVTIHPDDGSEPFTTEYELGGVHIQENRDLENIYDGPGSSPIGARVGRTRLVLTGFLSDVPAKTVFYETPSWRSCVEEVLTPEQFADDNSDDDDPYGSLGCP